MKWKNKGHEFDEIAKKLAKSKAYLFGAGEVGSRVYEYIEKDKFLGFIDNNKEKCESGLKNESVYMLEQIDLKENEMIVLCLLSEEQLKEIKTQLRLYGISNDKIIKWDLYIQVRELYERERVILNGIINVSLTERCTLNCKHCSIMTSYIKNKSDYTLEQKIKDIQFLFDKVDYVRCLGIVGGEPFLFKELPEYIEGILNYGDKIGSVGLVTNGTLIPKDEVLIALKKANIHVTISEYPNVIPNLNKTREKLINKLAEFEISYTCLKVESWVDYMCYDIEEKKQKVNLGEFFTGCNTKCRLLADGKIYYCATGKFIKRAIKFEETDDENNIFNLCSSKNSSDLWKSELIEFDNGYSNEGYIKACLYCNGDIGINENYVEVAQQA